MLHAELLNGEERKTNVLIPTSSHRPSMASIHGAAVTLIHAVVVDREEIK